jgi:guanylate kinase
VLFLVSAPSGAGKTTVGRGLLDSVPGMVRAVTCTTRPPRAGEQDGVDYHFLAPAVFLERVGRGEFLEHAEVYGNRYGTLKSEVLRRLEDGHDVLLSVDVQGADSIRESAGRDPVLAAALVSVFIMPPSVAELGRRLRGRAQDGPEVIARRLAEARAEMARWPGFDYVVVSGSMAEDLAAMQRILAVERLRTRRIRALDIV